MPNAHDIVTEVGKATPPVAVASAELLFDLSLDDWVLVATLVYVSLQAFVLVRDKILPSKWPWRRKR